MRTVAMGLLAGLLLGAPHLDGVAAPLAWVGLALLGHLLRVGSRRQRVVLVLTSGVAGYGLALSWMWWAFAHFLSVPLWRGALPGLGVVAVMVVCTRLPMVLGALSPLPVWLWLPVSWVLGEWLAEVGPHLNHAALLHGQYQVRPVLWGVALLGWYPSMGMLVFWGVAAGRALRSVRWGVLTLGLAIGAWWLPRPPNHADRLAGLAIVQMADAEAVPGGLDHVAADVVIWPEGARRERPRLAEGAVSAHPLREPMPGPDGATHLVGLRTLSPLGPQNAVARVEGQAITAIRAKSGLVPGYERPLLGVMEANQATVPGRAAPYLEVAGRRLVPLICYEAFERGLVHEGVDAGGEILVLISSDRVHVRGQPGNEQSIAALVLRSVESGLPAVRAAMWGEAALVLADGTLVERLPAGGTGLIVPE